MTVKEFVRWLYPFTKGGEINHVFVIAQAALESGWGKKKVGNNNLFGVTKGSWNGKTVLVKTTEFFSSPGIKFDPPEEVHSVTKMPGGRYKYSVSRLFRDYDSVKQCLDDHLDILKKPHFDHAWPHRNDPRKYVQALQSGKYKYATGPAYVPTMLKIISMVEKELKDISLSESKGREGRVSNAKESSGGKNLPPCSANIYRGSDVCEIQKLIDNLKEKKYISDISKEDFLKFSDGTKTNAQKILEKYNPEMKKKYEDEIKNNQPPVIVPGTPYTLPSSNINVEIEELLSSDLFLEQKSDFTAYWTEKQTQLLSDPNYVHWETFSGGMTQAQLKALNLQVWIYSISNNSIFNVSPWVRSCSTSKDMNVGNFSLELIPTDEIVDGGGAVPIARQYNVVDNYGNINLDWFTKNVQTNDVVFIRYERLKLEGEKEVGNVSTSQLTNKLVWDMIGLVDNVMTSINAESTDYFINISGRDLMKLFIEDGSYFIPLRYVEGSPDRWFYGGDPESSWFKRNMVSGSYDNYLMYEFQRIDSYSSFIINCLSNIGIVPDSVFEGCSRRKEAKGVWKIVKMYVDKILDDRRIVDFSLANPEGTLLDLFNKICQKPFVEFWGDTWGSGFDITIRQPPHTKSAIQSVVNNSEFISISSSDILSLSLQYDDRVYGWYRLMPQNALMGSSQFSSLAFTPIIFLDEFVSRFGNKRLITTDIYLSEKSLKGSEGDRNENTMISALQSDLLYTIETNAYLPFTRKGTITLNGDRRIKVGTFILCEATQELFYVLSVNNSITISDSSIDRITTITVERGMRLDCITDPNINYFNIVDIERIRNSLKKQGSEDTNRNESSDNIGVNKKSFEYFISRKFYDTDRK